MSDPEPDPGLSTRAFDLIVGIADSLSSASGLPVGLFWGAFAAIGITIFWILLVTVENIIRWVRYMVMVLWALVIAGFSIALALLT